MRGLLYYQEKYEKRSQQEKKTVECLIKRRYMQRRSAMRKTDKGGYSKKYTGYTYVKKCYSGTDGQTKSHSWINSSPLSLSSPPPPKEPFVLEIVRNRRHPTILTIKCLKFFLFLFLPPFDGISFIYHLL